MPRLRYDIDATPMDTLLMLRLCYVTLLLRAIFCLRLRAHNGRQQASAQSECGASARAALWRARYNSDICYAIAAAYGGLARGWRRYIERVDIAAATLRAAAFVR